MYYSQWGAKDLFPDARGDDAELLASMVSDGGRYELDESLKATTEALMTNEPFEALVMKYSNEEALFIRYLGQEDYTGYRPLAIMPIKDYTASLRDVRTENGTMSSEAFGIALSSLETLSYPYPTEPIRGDDSSLYAVMGEIERFFGDYPTEYRTLIPITDNRDAKAFEWLASQGEVYLTQTSDFNAVLIHEGTSHPLLDSMQERYKELQKSFEATGYTVKQLFESACEHYAKIIDIRAEYLFWLIIYPCQMRSKQHITIGIGDDMPYVERAEQLTTLIPSFSPVAGIGIEKEYGIVNAPYMMDSVFISPLSRGGAKTMINRLWNGIESRAIKSSSTYPINIISELKKQNLWE